MTLVPDMAVTGVLAIIAALAVGVWAVWFIQRPHGGLILIALSVFLLVAGGGFGPPMLAAIIGVAATRIGKQRRTEPGSLGSAVAEAWPWLLGSRAGPPGMVVVSLVTGFDNPYLVSRLMFVAFAGSDLFPGCCPNARPIDSWEVELMDKAGSIDTRRIESAESFQRSPPPLQSFAEPGREL